jgi:hypothetical protein
VWSPEIDNTPSVYERLKQMDLPANNLGWGVDWAALAFAYTNGFVAVGDRGVLIHHPLGTGYDRGKASQLMRVFLSGLTALCYFGEVDGIESRDISRLFIASRADANQRQTGSDAALAVPAEQSPGALVGYGDDIISGERQDDISVEGSKSDGVLEASPRRGGAIDLEGEDALGLPIDRAPRVTNAHKMKVDAINPGRVDRYARRTSDMGHVGTQAAILTEQDAAPLENLLFLGGIEDVGIGRGRGRIGHGPPGYQQ